MELVATAGICAAELFSPPPMECLSGPCVNRLPSRMRMLGARKIGSQSSNIPRELNPDGGPCSLEAEES